MIDPIAVKTFLYSAETLMFGVLTFLLWMFYRGLGRQYVKFWALSLGCICVNQITMLIDAQLVFLPDVSPGKIGLEWLSQTSRYLFLVFFGIGIYAAKKNIHVALKSTVMYVSIFFTIASLATFIAATDPESVYDRFHLRETLPALIFGCLYFALGSFLVWNKPQHFSSRIFTYFSFICGTHYLLFSFASTLAINEQWFLYFQHFSVYFDLSAMTILGFIMLIWMQGAERNAALVAINKAQYLGKHDSLTGTLNRAQVLEKLPSQMEWAQRNNQNIAVLLIDIKRFKFINDTYGLKTGDYILGEVARRIHDSIFKPSVVGRLSGDSFAIAIDYEQDEQLEHISNNLHELVGRAFHYEGQDIFIQCSLGYCCFPEDADNAEGLLHNANLALYQAEMNNIASIRFSDEMQVEGRHLLAMEKAINQGLHKEEFELYFQPQLNLLTNKLEGVEALVRWNHPEQGLLSPDKFLPDVDTLELNSEFDVYILKKACEAHSRWYDTYKKRVNIAVNITAVEFQNPNFISTIQRLLLEHRVPPNYLELEITENVVMTDIRTAMNIIVVLQNTGIKVSIDDFGTGYSSLAYLRELPIDKIKIDRSFIREVATNDSDLTIVKSMIKLSHGLGKRVLAEGVETSAQLNILRKLQCDAVQGYFISKPIPEQAFKKYLVRK